MPALVNDDGYAWLSDEVDKPADHDGTDSVPARLEYDGFMAESQAMDDQGSSLDLEAPVFDADMDADVGHSNLVPENDLVGKQDMDVDDGRPTLDLLLASAAAPRGGERLQEWDSIQAAATNQVVTISDSPVKTDAPLFSIPLSRMSPQERVDKLSELLAIVKQRMSESSSAKVPATSSASESGVGLKYVILKNV